MKHVIFEGIGDILVCRHSLISCSPSGDQTTEKLRCKKKSFSNTGHLHLKFNYQIPLCLTYNGDKVVYLNRNLL